MSTGWIIALICLGIYIVAMGIIGVLIIIGGLRARRKGQTKRLN